MAVQAQITSQLEIFSVENNVRTIVYSDTVHFEAPNWSSDGSYLIFNQKGLLYRLNLHDKIKIKIPTYFADQCNNDHGISPDGKLLAISNNDEISGETSGTSRIYVLPIDGGKPKIVTPQFPSYWHGWSPDSKKVLYTAKRNGDYNIYEKPIDGGVETQLTFEAGLDDGPEYDTKGQYIYYNSMASGKMELWRMQPDGTKKEQLTDDAYSNWFPHPSPNEKHLVYLSYLHDQGESHPAMKQVALRLYNLQTMKSKTLCTFIGGQGTINVPSWSPDGDQFAFVSYLEN